MKTIYLIDNNQCRKTFKYHEISELKAEIYEANITIGSNVIFGNNVTLNIGVNIKNDVVIGDNTYIGYCIRIAEDVKIGNNCIIGNYTCICHDVIINNNVIIGKSNSIGKNTIIENKAKIGNKVCICSNVKVGNKAKIQDELYIAKGSNIKKKETIKHKKTIKEKNLRDIILDKIPLTYSINLIKFFLILKIQLRHIIKYNEKCRIDIEHSPFSESVYLYYMSPIWNNIYEYRRNYIKIRISGHKPTPRENSQIRILI